MEIASTMLDRASRLPRKFLDDSIRAKRKRSAADGDTISYVTRPPPEMQALKKGAAPSTVRATRVLRRPTGGGFVKDMTVPTQLRLNSVADVLLLSMVVLEIWRRRVFRECYKEYGQIF